MAQPAKVPMMLSPSLPMLLSVPQRVYIQMLPQPIVPWTPARLMRSSWQWLMAETGEQGSVKISEG